MVGAVHSLLPIGMPFHGHAILERLIDACGAPLQAFAAGTEDGRAARIYCLEATSVTPADRERFAARLKELQRIEHERIPRILDGGLDEGLFWISVAAIEGQSLFHRVTSDGPLEPMHAVMMLRDVVGPLRAARDAGVLHHRLTPRHLLTTTAECRAVLEMGFDRLFGVAEDGCNVAYRAPEQLDPSRRADERADIYALGAVTHFALGAPPFEAEDGFFDPERVRHQILNDALPPISSVCAGCPPELDHLLRSMCAKREEDRPRSLEILDEMLKGALAACVARRKGKGAASYPVPLGQEVEEPGEPSPPPPAEEPQQLPASLATEEPPLPARSDAESPRRFALRSAVVAALVLGSGAVVLSTGALLLAGRREPPVTATPAFFIPVSQPPAFVAIAEASSPAPPPPRASEPGVPSRARPLLTRADQSSADQWPAELVARFLPAGERRGRITLYPPEAR